MFLFVCVFERLAEREKNKKNEERNKIMNLSLTVKVNCYVTMIFKGAAETKISTN